MLGAVETDLQRNPIRKSLTPSYQASFIEIKIIYTIHKSVILGLYIKLN